MISKNQDLNGFVLINKPISWSSFDVVAKIRGTLKKELNRKIKVGHTGTLDPLASGLMIIVVGDYCKKAAEFSNMDKSYIATLTLGATSSTDDAEGELKLSHENGETPDKSQILSALTKFEGSISQVPPIFSAIKIDGKRAYKMARKGQEVEMKPRQVKVHKIKLLSYEYPKIVLDCSVSSGTYIRSLARDIGQELKTGAYLSGLERTTVGPYSLEDAIAPGDYSSQIELRKVATNL